MITRDQFISHSVNIEELDRSTVRELPEEDYRAYVHNSMLFVDHGDVLVFDLTGSVLATTRAQLDILISELKALREDLPA